MADITMSSPAQVIAPSQNAMGLQFVARGTYTFPMAAQRGQARGKVGASPLTCVLQLQSNGNPVPQGQGQPFTDGTNWLARFGPLSGLTTPPYQLVANAPTTTEDTSVTALQLYFDPTIQLAITNYPALPSWPRLFRVSGTYSPCPGPNDYLGYCNLRDSSGTVLAGGSINMGVPQAGQWFVDFNLANGIPSCWLLMEIQRNGTPFEFVASAWIDGITIP
jgi:hypothetical protein